jgi:hypothetical protein
MKYYGEEEKKERKEIIVRQEVYPFGLLGDILH